MIKVNVKQTPSYNSTTFGLLKVGEFFTYPSGDPCSGEVFLKISDVGSRNVMAIAFEGFEFGNISTEESIRPVIRISDVTINVTLP